VQHAQQHSDQHLWASLTQQQRLLALPVIPSPLASILNVNCRCTVASKNHSNRTYHGCKSHVLNAVWLNGVDSVLNLRMSDSNNRIGVSTCNGSHEAIVIPAQHMATLVQAMAVAVLQVKAGEIPAGAAILASIKCTATVIGN